MQNVLKEKANAFFMENTAASLHPYDNEHSQCAPCARPGPKHIFGSAVQQNVNVIRDCAAYTWRHAGDECFIHPTEFY